MRKMFSDIFYLASSSPRRKQLLQELGIQFKTLVSNVDEIPHPDKINKFNDLSLVMDIAAGKMQGAYENLTKKKSISGLILSADTLVFCGKKVLGKPKSKLEAAAMLKLLSNRTHTVATGVTVARLIAGEITSVENRLVTTNVTFRNIDQPELDWYLSTGEPMDKAGAYGAQGGGAVFIEKIDGSYSNVVGLPLAETMNLVEEVTGLPWHIWTK